MNAIALTLSGLSTLLVFFTAICGFWIRAHAATPDSVTFHMQLATGTMLVVLVTIGMLVVLLLKH